MMATQAAAPAAVSTGDHDRLIEVSLVKWHFLTGFAFLLIAMLAGLLFSMQFLQQYPFKGIEIFSPGRWRFVHTQGVAYGFIANIFLGMLYWAVPRLTHRPVLSRPLSWFLFFAWQAVILATAIGVLLGQAQALEWGETPVWIDPVAEIGLILVAVNFLAPVFKTKGPMYVTLWYFVAALVWTPLVYAMGNFLPQYLMTGVAAGAIGGLFIHDLVGLFVTPLGWGMMYYFVPIILKKPIWSHGLSLVGFWGLAFFYPLNGIHHFLYTPIPMFLQYGAIISTVAVELVVTTVIINFFMTIRGTGDMLRTSIPIRWFYTGMIFYFTTCLQCAFHTTLTFQKIIHFSDWVVGHAHLVMFGVFGFWMLGLLVHLLPRVCNRAGWYSRGLNEWHFWITALSMLVMFFDLMIAGLIQGYMWRDLAAWEETIRASRPYWLVRSVSGTAIIVAQFLFAYNVIRTLAMSPAPEAAPDGEAAPDPTAGGLATA
ncbi:MAG: cbb3-type cytochrome c oxidase subunit I [Phycisphaerales bacterium]|nr:cbb3-type cytochrome c oxidase subunit I [Phycisphaerales bacterium]